MDNEWKGSWVINDNQCLIFYHDFILSMFSYFPCFYFFKDLSVATALKPGGWIQRWAACPPTQRTSCICPSQAGTGTPCSLGAQRRSRLLRTPCKSGHCCFSSSRGRQASCLPSPSTDLQSLAFPKLSASMNSPPGRNKWKNANVCIVGFCIILWIDYTPFTHIYSHLHFE